jgi:siroheme synthase
MKQGKVYLVGAGPGDPKLITVRGAECIREADVILYDRLANSALLEYARPDVELIYGGKMPKNHTLRQEEINQLLVDKALEGHIVCRLKGGDPSVFGRVGEEALLLAQHNIPFEIVPGVTSGIAAAAYAGIPVTHREYASSFAMVTGHDTDEEDGLDGIATGTEAEKSGSTPPRRKKVNWAALAQGVDTIAFYMGTGRLGQICDRLMTYGRDPQTPVAVIEWGTTPDQRTVTGSLLTIVEKVQQHDLKHPAIILVGEVVQLREQLQWFQEKPL